MARIVTKTGDKGTTGIFGGERVAKDNPRIEANGAMDELNAHLGLIRALLPQDDERNIFLYNLQRQIMQMMSLIATPSSRRSENPNKFELAWLEAVEEETKRFLETTPIMAVSFYPEVQSFLRTCRLLVLFAVEQSVGYGHLSA